MNKEEIEKSLKVISQSTIFIDTQDMEERYGEELYKEYLENENHQLKDRIEKATKLIKDKTKIIPDEEGGGLILSDYDIRDLLEILKGEENG